MINSALEPDQVFDLPWALIEIKRAFTKIEELSSILIQSNEREEQLMVENQEMAAQARKSQMELIQVES